MLLHSLLRRLDPAPTLEGIPDIEIGGVQEDSRLVRPGDLFVARPGTRTDGGHFVRDAHARGAVAAITHSPVPDCPIVQVILPDPATATARLAQAIVGDPTRHLSVFGITGTNGKTTTAYLLRDLLNAAGRKCGMIGTVETDDGRDRVEASMTTPGPVVLADLLASMRRHGCKACAMEVSSHSLDQSRVGGFRFAAAAFTNLTGDHLDYHPSMDAYAEAKARLFAMLPEDAVAVVNARDPYSARMVRDCPARVVRFGIGGNAEWRAQHVVVTASGTQFELHTPDGNAHVELGLIGKHNVENALAAAALAGEALGLGVGHIAAALKPAAGAPGRLQPIRLGQSFAVLVDYAHTDDALANVLQALRPLCKGSLRLLFGCGGDRDPHKRPRMAAVAEQLADALYLTSDNPRTEDAGKILDQVAAGLPADTAKKVVIEPDRRAAIGQIIADARPGDVVLLAGKGHENYQIIGTEKRHFDDVEEATKALQSSARA